MNSFFHRFIPFHYILPVPFFVYLHYKYTSCTIFLSNTIRFHFPLARMGAPSTAIRFNNVFTILAVMT